MVCSVPTGPSGGRGQIFGGVAEGHPVSPCSLSPSARRHLRVVGLSGRTGSGKTSAASVLELAGYTVLSTRSVLARILHSRGEQVTRTSLQRLGREVNEGFGQRWLLDRVVVPIQDSGCYVIDALRFPEDHEYLLERYGPVFLHLHIEAPVELRRDRFIRRGGTMEEFRTAESHMTEAMAPRMRQLAHYIIVNDQPPEHRDATVLLAVREPTRGAPGCQ